jgi:hypothetical protein
MGLLIKLKNGDTALKSVPAGNDRPGGGSSGQPYIKNSINEPTTPLDPDSIIRGGLMAPTSALEDVVRLTKYFFDFKNPDGILFTVKQNLLSRISPKTEASFGLAYGGLSKNIDLKTGVTSVNQSNGVLNAGVYTPLSTIAQAGVGWAGIHLNKQGIDPTGLIPFLSINKYQDVVYANNKSIPEDPKVPLSLVRKSQRASDKAGRKTSKLLNQQLKTQSELNANFQELNNLPSSEFNQQTKSQKVISGFLEKWDKYLDEQSLKKLKRKENAADKAIDKSTSLYNQVQEAESAPKVYTNRLLKLWNDSGLNLNNAFTSISSTLYSYGGGPDSVLGVGKTNINFATTNDGVTPSRTNNIPFDNLTRPEVRYSTINIFGDENSSVSLRYVVDKDKDLTEHDIFGNDNYLEIYNNTTSDRLGITTNPSNPSSGNGDPNSSQFQTWNEQDLIGFSSINPNSRTTPDFRNILPSDYTKTFSGTPYTQNNNIETLFNLGSPGQKGILTDYKRGKENTNTPGKYYPLDKVNASYIYKSLATSGYRKDPEYDDLIPFVIGILNNDKQTSGTYIKYMHFRAYIKKISDSYKADWKGMEYMGRAETFYRYKGFDRDMSISFTIVAQSVQELNPMYDKLNFLASSLAPEYLDDAITGASGYMAGNITYLTIGDYIVEQPGIITSLGFDIPDESPWETGRDRTGTLYDPTDPQSPKRLPHMIEVDLKFIPIHTFRPQKLYFPYDKTTGRDELTDLGPQKYINPNRITKPGDYTQEGINLLNGNL